MVARKTFVSHLLTKLLGFIDNNSPRGALALVWHHGASMRSDFSHTLAASQAPTLASYARWLAPRWLTSQNRPQNARLIAAFNGVPKFLPSLTLALVTRERIEALADLAPQFFSSTHRRRRVHRQGDLRGRCRKVSVARESPSWSSSLALEERHASPGALSLSTGIILSPCCCQLSAFAKVLTSQCRSRSNQLEFGLAIAFRVSVGTCRSFLCSCLFLGNSHAVTCKWQDQLCL